VLGSSVLKAFKRSSDFEVVVGLANSRSGEGLQKLDLTNSEDVDSLFSELKPNCTSSDPILTALDHKFP